MELQRIEYDLSVCKIDDIKQIDFSREFFVLSKTADEISLVCETDHIPPGAMASEHGWKALKVAEVLDFGMIGVIAKISGILAEAEISIFVVSTFNTDYMLMKDKHFDKGVKALMRNGFLIR